MWEPTLRDLDTLVRWVTYLTRRKYSAAQRLLDDKPQAWSSFRDSSLSALLKHVSTHQGMDDLLLMQKGEIGHTSQYEGICM
jgi:hypothetical protein